MAKSIVISAYADKIAKYAGFTARVKRQDVDARFASVIGQMYSEELLTASEWSGFDAIWYGLHWYVQTGRATLEIESELKSLSGPQLIRLVVKIWLDGVNVSGNVGQWLQKYQKSYARMIK